MKHMSSRPLYHVRHDLQPKLAEELLILLWDKCPCRVNVLQQGARDRGYRLANRSSDQLLTSLGNLRIIKRKEHGEIYLSELGKLVANAAKYNPALVPDLIHFTYFTFYNKKEPSSRFSWAYQLVCKHLWQLRSTAINAHHLVTLVQEQAQVTFPDYNEYGISFSQNSVAGIVNWLEALNPSCVTHSQSGERLFSRRQYCSNELLLLALEYMRVKDGNLLGAQLRLSNDVRQAIACLCLVEEEYLDDLFQSTAEAFDLILRQTERGNWISLLGNRSPFPLTDWFSSSTEEPIFE
jgi:hypothetical protein